METKRTVALIIIMMVILLFWTPVARKIQQMMGYDTSVPAQIADTAPTTAPTTAQTSTSTSQSAEQAPSTHPQMSAAPAGIRPIASTQHAKTELGSPATSDKEFHLSVSLDSNGAGVDAVTLNEFKAGATSLDPYIFQHPYENFESISRPLATRAIAIDGATIDLTNSVWSLDNSTKTTATFSLPLSGPNGESLALLTKTFTIFSATDASNGNGYEVQVTQTIQNLTTKAISAGVTFNGPTTPPRELDRGSDRMMIGGYLNADGVYVMQHYIESFSSSKPTMDFSKADKDNYPLLWAGTASVYFDALILPLEEGSPTPKFVGKVSATVLNPGVDDAKLHQVAMTFETTPSQIEPGSTQTISTRAFFGPKKRELLTKGDFYTTLPRKFDATLVITSGLCGYCTFDWLIRILVGMLNAFHWVLFRDWGLAIIALVFIVRLILHPITKKSQENMAHMSKFGPEMEKLKAKHKDDQDALNKAMVGFYKEHGATPILGCLPMFLQMPIWIALWQALQTTFELRHAGFLRWGNVHLTWIKDLSQPDHLITLAHPFNLWILPISGLNILPILLGIVFFVQQKYFTPKPPTMTPEQEQQQKMMQWMTGALFPLMLYGGPSGLNLYILTSTTFGIIESKRIRDHIKRKDEAEKAGKVFVDAGKKIGGKRDKFGGGDQEKPKGWLATKLEELKSRAEQIQRDAQRPKK